MAPRHKPTFLKIIAGNPGKRPLPQREAKVRPARPVPPAHLAAEALVEWGRVVEELYEVGLLASVDRAALAAYCQAYSRWVRAEEAIAVMAERDGVTGALLIKTTNGNYIQNPLVGTANKAASDMVRYASEFGMTPSARSRIDASPPGKEDTDPAAKYFA